VRNRDGEGGREREREGGRERRKGKIEKVGYGVRKREGEMKRKKSRETELHLLKV
jgi:hypothetical protein